MAVEQDIAREPWLFYRTNAIAEAAAAAKQTWLTAFARYE